MELRQLRCFIAVAEYLSFTEAAEKLHLVQSAVSHNIAELEKELNTKLFFRNKQSIVLTPVGELLLDHAYKITAMERDTITNVQLRLSGITGSMSVGYVFVPVAWCMFEKFKSFSQKYPHIRVKYNSYHDIRIARQLENFDLDVGFARIATITDQERINWHPIYKEKLQIVVSEDHPLSGLERASLAQFKDEPLILMNHRTNPGLYDMSMQLYLKKGFMPRIIDDINDERTVNMLTEIGYGFTILPSCWKVFVNPSLKFIDIVDEDTTHYMGLAWNKENTNPCIKLFLAEMGIPVSDGQICPARAAET